MLMSNFKLVGAFFLCCSLLNSACASETEVHKSYARSAAASSMRSTVSRKEENIVRPVKYGVPDKLYHPIATELFKRDAVFDNWDALFELVKPNTKNSWSPQFPERVRNVVVDTGMFCIVRDLTEPTRDKAYLHALNLMRFLLHDTFAQSEFHSWQGSFAKVVGQHDASVFLNLVRNNPDQALQNNTFKVFSNLFFGENRILQQYNTARTSDANGERGNNFAHFEALFSSVVDSWLFEQAEKRRLQAEQAEISKLKTKNAQLEAELKAEKENKCAIQ